MKVARWLVFALLAGSLVLAAGTGYLTAVAFGVGAQAPSSTTTINAGEGATGPAGPQGPAGGNGEPGAQGPAGTPGAESCPTGSHFGAVRINHPEGHVTIWTCIAE